MKVDGNGKAAVLTEEQLDQLLNAAPAANHRALWAIQRWTAARVSEALSLQWRAVDGGMVTFKRRTTKTNRTKQVDVGQRLAVELNRYREAWRKAHGRDPKPGDYLFPARSSMKETMTRQAADLALRSTLAGLAIPGASTHSFRRSLATNALRRGCSLKAIQKVTGHKSLEGLGEYLDVAGSEVMSVIEG
ncbi:phage integrase [Synechococcus sp. BIOS-E4-1]|uniref:tyrosine-type recombinase/integrase n=1 Tax=Synechococcus sp. BIOS-E4-1 TaxID=1400864 RepID=UPI0016452F5D|nr:site-specific integrase [Synechococcus sp. BIOS-E4-1]QNI53981.1 phage integrase [Synechococcus sp. BIOS-E4-1]